MSGVAHSDIILSCDVSVFSASISVLKTLRIGSHLSVSFFHFNPANSRLASKQKAN